MFSHPSKLELIDTAHAANYTVVLHVVLIPEELAVAARRLPGASGWASGGGEQDPPALPPAVGAGRRSDRAMRPGTVYDNSGIKGPRIVAQMTDGFIVGARLAGLDTARR